MDDLATTKYTSTTFVPLASRDDKAFGRVDERAETEKSLYTEILGPRVADRRKGPA